MAQSKSSKRWLREHFNDNYVKLARQNDYRSRAAYKLLEIQQKDNLIRPGAIVVDLGAAPGGWSEVAAKLVGRTGKVFAVDILPIKPIVGVEFIQGDFTKKEVQEILLNRLNRLPVDLVISDMAPHISGIEAMDQARSIYLVESAFDFAKLTLKPGGMFLVKVFQGKAFDILLKIIKERFVKVTIHKPKASRARSREIFLLAKGYKVI
ncbi:MAG: 23S rRNA methyltransferase [Coxiella sp. DG_40]|nr:MAG: 23S rRNA methyltransferase [Coxiella sp. DG_40]